MKKQAIVFEAPRTGYSIDQINKPVTVGELKAFLEDLDDDTLFILSHDRCYTYGTISRIGYMYEQDDEESSFEDIGDEYRI